MESEFFTLQNDAQTGWVALIAIPRKDGTRLVLDYQAMETDGEFLAKWHGWPSYYGRGPFRQVLFETREWAEKFMEEYWIPQMLVQRMTK